MDIQIPETAGILIIAMAAHAMSGEREKSPAAGMDEPITKPIAPRQLRDMLPRHVGGNQA